MTGHIRVGVGGWTYEPWRGLFFPPGLPAKQELHHAGRRLRSIELLGRVKHLGAGPFSSYQR